MTRISKLRIGIVQRVLPAYRVALFDLLADAFDGDVSVFAGEGRKHEMINTRLPKKAEYQPAQNIHLLNGPFYICWQKGLVKWLDNWKPDMLIMEANPRYLHSPTAVRWMWAKGGKVIGWGLGSPALDRDLFGLRALLRRRFVSQFDAMITYSRKGAHEYEMLGVDRARIFVAPNAVAPKPTRLLLKRPKKFRGGKPVVVFVGRLQERKRVDTLIRACAALPGGSQPLLWIIGDGPGRDDLEKLASDVYPLAEFFGAQHGEELAKRLQLADIFVLPGTGGLAVQEAMSFGLPVIVGKADGTQSDLVRSENGWLLTQNSVDELISTIAEALENVNELRKKGEESYRIVNEEINLEGMVKVFTEAIVEVMRA